jgi:hypothetical protein
MRMNGGWDFAMAWIADLVKSGLFGERHTQLRHTDMDARITSIQLRVPAHYINLQILSSPNLPLGLDMCSRLKILSFYYILSIKIELCNLLRWPRDGILLRFSITHQQARTSCSLKFMRRVDVRAWRKLSSDELELILANLKPTGEHLPTKNRLESVIAKLTWTGFMWSSKIPHKPCLLRVT